MMYKVEVLESPLLVILDKLVVEMSSWEIIGTVLVKI
jgi:hypothetical protein